jgi:hypothetical protein
MDNIDTKENTNRKNVKAALGSCTKLRGVMAQDPPPREVFQALETVEHYYLDLLQPAAKAEAPAEGKGKGKMAIFPPNAKPVQQETALKRLGMR